MERMDRNMRKKDNTWVYITGGIVGIAIIAFIITYIIYGNYMNEQAQESFDTEKIVGLMPDESSDSEYSQASTSMGKTVNEVQEETVIIENQINEIEEDIINSTPEENVVQEEETSSIKIEENEQNDVEEQIIEEKELEFMMPVEGEIMQKFAKDELVFSNTLQEWVTHNGIDIKAEKTTVVKASEAGTVKSIKNDPRYGLTVVIEHQDGFSTSYSNLLTAEFIKEGEEVEKGQTIGTVGNTATFEIADESHLHFEILQNNEAVDPTMYIK